MSLQRSPAPGNSGKRTPASRVPPKSTEIPRLDTPSGDIELSQIWELLRNLQQRLVSMQEQQDKLAETVEEIANEQVEEREALTLLKDRTTSINDSLDAILRPKTPPQGTSYGPEATPRPTTGLTILHSTGAIHSPTPRRATGGVTFMPELGSPIKKLSPSPHSTGAPPKATTPATAPRAITPTAAPRATTTARAVTPAATKPPKMKEPESFDGVRGRSAKQWWTKVMVWAAFQRPNYDSEEALVLHILTLMKPGKASDWAQPLMEKAVNHDATAPRTITQLAKLFGNAFTDPDASRAAMRQLSQLHQTADANAYTTEFNNLAADLDWNDEAALKAQYEQGLSFRVRSQLIQRNPYPATLAALQEAAIKIDGLYQELDQSNPRRKAQGPAEEKSKTQGGATKKREAMSLEERKKLPNYVSEEERKARKEAGLCIKCGSPDHMFRECPNGWRKERVPGKGKAKETAKVAEESESEKE